jgi:phosphoribosylaminoimidazolecarboxamide formyltransferase/IMP cyclohydrolase
MTSQQNATIPMDKNAAASARAVKIKRALLSVSDKKGLIEFAQALSAHGVELLSTGGTAKAIKEAGITVKDVSDHTGFPEMMDGRVKTLHPTVHGGILSVRDNQAHVQAQKEHGIGDIDLVVVNLYPFVQTVASGADFETCIENIDIGGPAMVRSAAKNHEFVTIITDPADYNAVIEEMNNFAARPATLCVKNSPPAPMRTPPRMMPTSPAGSPIRTRNEPFPRQISFTGTLKQSLRYGENPHQNAALYLTENSKRPGAARARRYRARNCPITISTTPMPPLNLSPNSTSRPWPSSNTPTRAVWRWAIMSWRRIQARAAL